MLRRTFTGIVSAAVGSSVVLTAGNAKAQTPVKLSLDWAFEGQHAPFAAAIKQGYFKRNGLDVKIDRGYGSGDTVNKVATGAYDIGYGDTNVLVKFNHDNPNSKVVCVFLLYDVTINSVLARKDRGITKVTDLPGKRLASPVQSNSRVLFPLFAREAGIDAAKVQWMTVQPNIRDAMMVRGEADGVSALETAKFSIRQMGLPEGQISVFRFSAYLPDLMDRGILVSQKTLKERPEVIRAFLQALVEGTRDAVADPKAATDALIKFDNLLDAKLELERFQLNLEQSMLTKNVRENGVSSVTSERLRKSLALAAESFSVPAPAEAGDYYTDSLLPSASQRMITTK
jgi:NitT/TauT family transport system substrate-binding protein